MARHPSVAAEPADEISAAQAGTLPGLFRARVARSPDAAAYTEFDSGSGQWRAQRWRDIQARMARWRAGLEREGLQPGDRVAILLRNCVEWVCFDQAALAAGLVVVPLYTTDSTEGLLHGLADSGARLLLLEGEAQWRPIAARRAAIPALRTILCLRGGRAADLVAVADWLPAQGSDAPDQAGDPDGLATLIYTSGTTGAPKGVMLSHRGILFVAEAVLERNPGLRDDVFLSYLPLAHSFERVVGYYLPIMSGGQVVYARSIEQLAEDLLTARPTVLLGVPRIYERLYAAIRAKAARSRLAAALLGRAEALGQDRFAAAQGRGPRPGPWARLQWAVLRRLVSARLLGRLGGRLRMAVSGGAPMPAQVARALTALGLPLVEGYGLTEASSAVTGDSAAHPTPGTVGPPLRGIEVSLGRDDELLVRGPGLMLGYWNQPERTRAAIDPDGWLHTGDIGVIRQDGRILIRGRLKDILVTSTGEKVPATDLETAIGLDPLVEQVVVLGEGKPFLVALLVLRSAAWMDLARRLGLPADEPASLRAGAAVAAVLGRVAAALRPFPDHAQVRAVSLSLQPWTIAEGLLTPTLKPRRPRLEARFAAEIAALYQGHPGFEGGGAGGRPPGPEQNAQRPGHPGA
ncbi:AMP-dependent synthetase/ligase [Roseicella aerolata]|uniref:AMP-dependent synthetase/ligase n=1 Tax=Roseicella aerolata TaxID=2883479 RepID=A0A9X1IFW4_9PROT|nr:AMP-dependent synthetase/ligase [Roseicella aerolata]MCB4823742.1 AMP-dependent synthetase/ligase [Roseicella aerolata]